MFLFLYHTQASGQVCDVLEEMVRGAWLNHHLKNRPAILLTWA